MDSLLLALCLGGGVASIHSSSSNNNRTLARRNFPRRVAGDGARCQYSAEQRGLLIRSPMCRPAPAQI